VVLVTAAFFVAAAAGLVQGPYPARTYAPSVRSSPDAGVLGLGGSTSDGPDAMGSGGDADTTPPLTGSSPPAGTGSPDPSPGEAGGEPPQGGTGIDQAPSGPSGFDLRRTAIAIGFPVAPAVDYRYRDNFLDRRDGVARIYNHVRAARPDGTLQRAHDGVDIYMKLGVRVRAPFSGTIIDPATRWKPWDPERYGVVAVVVSDEPATRGYAALLVHLATLDVAIGDHVRRGQRLGTLGRSGNADNPGIQPHLHFELRAPFRVRVREAGRIRLMDAFDPYPSLRAADPKAR
jgi:murein DD-endopeptidase MepM/ murein hydrolase activator NlpD